MAARLTPRLVELTYEALLSSFWRKSALSKFLRASGISERFLSAWSPEDTKRDFLDRAFVHLQASDRGKDGIYQMAKHLSEQTTFPDLRKWEDSAEKVAAAHKAVGELKAYLKQQDEELRSDNYREDAKKNAREERARIQRSLTDLAALQKRLDVLHFQVGTPQGGYAFQGWFYDFADFFDVDNRRPYTTNGRQIDGSITHEGTTYLIELKFTGQCGSTDVDSLRAKVEDKVDNTMGIMVAISGYSKVAIQGASGRRSLLLLLDAQHIYMCLSGAIRLGELLSRVRRHASQTGEAYLGVNRFGE